MIGYVGIYQFADGCKKIAVLYSGPDAKARMRTELKGLEYHKIYSRKSMANWDKKFGKIW